MNPRLLALIAIGALIAFVWAMVLVRDQFIGTEARRFLLDHGGLDLQRFFLTPAPNWGESRQAGQALFELTGRLCSADRACVNTVTAGLTALAVAVLISHTWQLLRSVVPAALVAVMWVASAPVLNVWLWQATWFDLLAFVLALGISGFWWWVFFRPVLTTTAAVAVSLGSLLAMAIAFNTKETLYLLVGVMALLAVVRSRDRGTLRRNLIMCTIPLAWGVWFIAYAVTHLTPSYAAHVGSGSIVAGLLRGAGMTLGLSPQFMSLSAVPSAGVDTLRVVAGGLFLVGAVAVGVAGAIAYRRWERPPMPRTARAAVILSRTWAVELYLGAILGVTVVLAARSNGLSAYYALLPWWAGLTLLMALLLRWRALPVAGILVYAVLVAYAALLEPSAVAPRMVDASRRLTASGAAAQSLLENRQVRSVTWRAEGTPFASWYLLRDQRQPPPGVSAGPDLWPWFTQRAESVPLRDLRQGTASEILDSLQEHAAPGEALVVVDDQYDLALVAFEGEVLFASGDLAVTLD